VIRMIEGAVFFDRAFDIDDNFTIPFL
jgi:dolichol kinase